KVAAGLGLEAPPAMPRALTKPAKPEVTKSAALSLTALPGELGIRSRKIAILVADGVQSQSVSEIQQALLAAGALPVLIGARLGAVRTADKKPLDVMATFENSPAVLFDAVVLLDGRPAPESLGQLKEFLVNQYRHCKTFLVQGGATSLLEKLGIPLRLADGKADPGIITDSPAKFIAALARHRHPERESDPPIV
ncbi:MAG: catalase HPII, partial [Steroidobacteraceae bacterium]